MVGPRRIATPSGAPCTTVRKRSSDAFSAVSARTTSSRSVRLPSSSLAPLAIRKASVTRASARNLAVRLAACDALGMRTARLGALVFTALALVGCGAERTAAVAPRTAPPTEQASILPALEPVNAVARHVGDFNVHVVSGSFRKRPALLTERVVAREDDAWVIEYKLEDDEGARSLRIWSDPNGEITRVALLVDGEEQPGTLDDYETFMASASLAPDENVGLTASTKSTCMVGPSELDCETKNYRVMLGEQ